jgi:hypothetical protein
MNEQEPQEVNGVWYWTTNRNPWSLPLDLFDALEGCKSTTVASYASRQAALDAFAAARAKVGETLPACDPDSLLDELDGIAREYDHYEYGLPHADDQRRAMRETVLRFVAVSAGAKSSPPARPA